MADNYLITGYWGEPHVTAENDRGINAAMFGAGRFVLPVGEQFRAEYIGNNTIRIYDGKLMNNGAAAGIPVGEYVDLLIANAGQGKKRNDLIVFQYSQDPSTLIESGVFTVIQGTETSGTASDPALTQADLLSGEATFDQMALWRIPVSGTTISAPVKLFSVSKDIPGLKAWAEGAFAPAGYGLGGYTYSDRVARTKAQLDAFKEIGFWSYQGGDSENLVSSGAYAYCYGLTVNYTANFAKQFAFSLEGVQIERDLNNGVWGEWGYPNPPMVPGVIYRTTRRHNGKPIYTTYINLGTVTNGSRVSTNINYNDYDIVHYECEAGGQPMPNINGSMDNEYTTFMWLSKRSNMHHINFFLGSAFTSADVFVTVDFVAK